MSHLACNICTVPVDGVAYRTKCLHLLCPGCSNSTFTKGCRCPVCSTVLTTEDVIEITIGIEVNKDYIDIALQTLLQKPVWPQVLEKLHDHLSNVNYVTSFIFCQLHNQIDKLESTTQMYKLEMQQMNKCADSALEDKNIEMHNVMSRFSSLERRYELLEKENMELKEAYKEKTKKCVAWEKAYNSIQGNRVMPISANNNDNNNDSDSITDQYSTDNESRSMHSNAYRIRKFTDTTTIRQAFLPTTSSSFSQPNQSRLPYEIPEHSNRISSHVSANNHKMHTASNMFTSPPNTGTISSNYLMSPIQSTHHDSSSITSYPMISTSSSSSPYRSQSTTNITSLIPSNMGTQQQMSADRDSPRMKMTRTDSYNNLHSMSQSSLSGQHPSYIHDTSLYANSSQVNKRSAHTMNDTILPHSSYQTTTSTTTQSMLPKFNLTMPTTSTAASPNLYHKNRNNYTTHGNTSVHQKSTFFD